ncbi:MAG: Rid family hydrolase [Akkermansia sp.]
MNTRCIQSSKSSSLGTFYALTSHQGSNFREEALQLLQEYEAVAGGEANDLMLRFHLSDVTQQADELIDLLGERNSFISIVGQAPANGARIALEAWCGHGHFDKILNKDEFGLSMKACWRDYSMIFMKSLRLNLVDKRGGSHEQMEEEWQKLDAQLSNYGAELVENVHRTWIYCRDIDHHYQGLVEARNSWFDRKGLTSDTHFIASTGIEGNMQESSRLVGMDSWALLGTSPEQIIYMTAEKFLSPTHIYGVSFERGTRIVFGNGSLYFISGTASIDAMGEILHEGDVRRQTRRAIENIRALMENHEGALHDLTLACVYLRNASDVDIVSDEINNSPLAMVPKLILKAPVCRPGWLVEIDAMGANSAGDSRFSPLR